MIYFLLCAYNEEKNILEVITKIRQLHCGEYKIVVVNDGSTDNTLSVLEKIKFDDLVVINHTKNLGLGMAMKTGLSYISKILNPTSDVVVTMDADNTHKVELVNLMLDKVRAGAELVIASRYCHGGAQYGVSFFRKMLSLCAKIILQVLFPYRNLKDYTSGYRLYSGKILYKLFSKYGEKFITQKTFVVQLELLIKLLEFRPVLCEVPLQLEYYKKYGKSKLKIIKNITSYIVTILKFKFSKNWA